MAREIYSYTLNILEKMSFDLNLFMKEFEKATQRLLPHELNELELWLNKHVFINPHLEPAKLLIKV